MLEKINPGQSVEGVLLLKTLSVKTTRTGKEYFDVVLCDKYAEIPCKMWDVPQALIDEPLAVGDLIYASFQVEEYEGNLQGKIRCLRPVLLTDAYDKSEIIPISPIEPQNLYDYILKVASEFKNEELRSIVEYIYAENKELLLFMPAAKSVHHDFVGGLLFHTFGMLRTAQAISHIYPSVNKELLCAGVILHDIYKTREFSTGPVGLVTEYSTCGNLLGHISMGATYISKVCDKLNVSEETSMLLQHMILSHHGEPEMGSAIVPKILEAKLLNLCDTIDAQVEIFNKALKGVEPGSFSQKVFALHNSTVYKPKEL